MECINCAYCGKFKTCSASYSLERADCTYSVILPACLNAFEMPNKNEIYREYIDSQHEWIYYVKSKYGYPILIEKCTCFKLKRS